MADVDEWGQIVMIGLLTRYARSQFVAPTPSEGVDPDLSLLLSSCRPLLQSRNCAVVLAVAQLLYYCAPNSLHPSISKSLIRLLRGPREVQNVVLMNIATICSVNPVCGVQIISVVFFISTTMRRFSAHKLHLFLGSLMFRILEGIASGQFSPGNETKFTALFKDLFEPYLKSFFVRPNDPKQIKVLKLQVLTLLISSTNVQLVLRELQVFIVLSILRFAPLLD